MAFRPSDFFIGVTDFFSVLLPGALVTYFLINPLFDLLFNEKIFPALTTGTEKWIAFLFAAYMIGNIIFGLSSILDKQVYDRFIRRFFIRNYNLPYRTATAIRNEFIPVDEWLMKFKNAKLITDAEFDALAANKKREIINTFKWAQYTLGSVQPDALTEIRKIEADSKFFRSLVLAFLIIGCCLLLNGYIIIGVSALGLCLLSLNSYGNLRYKSTERAYELVITLVHRKRRKAEDQTTLATDNRLQLKASVQVQAQHKDLIHHIMGNDTSATDLISVPQNKTWNIGPVQKEEVIYCISGRCLVNNGDSQKSMISSGALFRLTKNVSYEINNQQDEPLLFLSVK